MTPGYFATMRVPLLKGRDFMDADGLTSPPVIIVNEALVRSYFGDKDPILGAVGALQFEVLQARLKSEYTVDVRIEKLPFQHARRART